MGIILLVGIGCGLGETRFEDVEDATVWRMGVKGVRRVDFTAQQIYQLGSCLGHAKRVTEVPDEPLLPESYLVEVRDAHGDRSLELVSEHVLKGADGLWVSDCVHGIVVNAGP